MSKKRPVSLNSIAARHAGTSRLARPGLVATLAALLAICLTLLAARTAHAQVGVPGPQMPFPQPLGQRIGGGLDDDRSEPDQIDAARRFRALNDMRQKEIVSDTNKLLKLANELDAEVRKANSDSLTPEQLHKFAMIEKLAHNVKEHMSTPVAGMPVYLPPPPPIMR
jgi:hypothetical protein